MKIKPILFSTPMVRAILDGRKTQTRRVIKTQPIRNDCPIIPSEEWGFVQRKQIQESPARYEIYQSWKCPYGQPGDVLWVRETWQPSSSGVYVHFKADWADEDAGKGWKPSIHMPKSAARIFLQITNVRVERLKDISDEDAKQEGIQEFTKDGVGFKYGLDGWNWSCMSGSPFMCRNREFAFEELWKSINGEQSWDENPWVWVVEFKIIEKPKNF